MDTFTHHHMVFGVTICLVCQWTLLSFSENEMHIGSLSCFRHLYLLHLQASRFYIFRFLSNSFLINVSLFLVAFFWSILHIRYLQPSGWTLKEEFLPSGWLCLVSISFGLLFCLLRTCYVHGIPESRINYCFDYSFRFVVHLKVSTFLQISWNLQKMHTLLIW